MIKTILIALITIMLVAMPIMADAPHDYDINNDYAITAFDTGKVMANYGTYDTWHPYDFNRDFIVDTIDAQLVFNAEGTTLNLNYDHPYTGRVYIDGYKWCSSDHYKATEWYENWNCIKEHPYSHTYPYTCGDFAQEYEQSFTKDFGYRGLYYTINHYHAHTSCFTGGDILDDHNWIICSTNGLWIGSYFPYTNTLAIDVDNERLVLHGNDYYGWSAYIKWESGEHIGTFYH